MVIYIQHLTYYATHFHNVTYISWMRSSLNKYEINAYCKGHASLSVCPQISSSKPVYSDIMFRET